MTAHPTRRTCKACIRVALVSIAALAFLVDPGAALADWQQVRSKAMALHENGRHQEAYGLASVQAESAPVEARFVAGLVALRGLGQPSVAAQRFAEMAKAATSPEDRAAAGYWLGTAFHAAGSRERAKAAWSAAAGYGYTFYGQAAAAMLDARPMIATDPRARFTASTATAALSRGKGREAVRAHVAGDAKARDNALAALSMQGPREGAIAARTAVAMGAPWTAVDIARRWQAKGFPLIAAGYPDVEISWHDARVRRELVMAVQREESSFRQEASSPVGAQGSMQVMDGTARHVGELAGVEIDLTLMRTSRSYNVAVGSNYLALMLDRYAGNVMIALAAYNAGPGKADEWITRFGDPRSGRVLPADWVERITFKETRNYVKRVMASYVVYLSKSAGAS